MSATTTTSNLGWRGQQPDSIDSFFEMLECKPLEPFFEECGNFIFDLGKVETWPDGKVPRKYQGRELTGFTGRFAGGDFLFNIETNDSTLIDRLTVAIRANQKRGDYQALRRVAA